MKDVTGGDGRAGRGVDQLEHTAVDECADVFRELNLQRVRSGAACAGRREIKADVGDGRRGGVEDRTILEL